MILKLKDTSKQVKAKAKKREGGIFLPLLAFKGARKMIDTELINKAKKKSGLIEQIDAAWREFVDRCRKPSYG